MPPFSKRRFADALRADLEQAWLAFQLEAKGSTLVQFGTSVTEVARVQAIVAIGKTDAHFETELSEHSASESSLSREASLYELRLACFVDPAFTQDCERAQEFLDNRFEIDDDKLQDRIDHDVHEACREVMRDLDRTGFFGVGDARHRIALGGFGMDVATDFVLANVRALNPQPVLDWFERREPCADYFYRDLRSLAPLQRTDFLCPLWAAAILQDGNHRVAELAAAGIDRWTLEQELTRLGPRIIPNLISLIDQASLHPPLLGLPKPKGNDWSNHAELATSAVLLLAEVGDISDADIERLRNILRRSVARDAALPRTTTFSENLARLLHKLRPKRFPKSVQNGSTCHLMNPQDFI